jgi:hypothetical protein
MSEILYSKEKRMPSLATRKKAVAKAKKVPEKKFLLFILTL